MNLSPWSLPPDGHYGPQVARRAAGGDLASAAGHHSTAQRTSPSQNRGYRQRAGPSPSFVKWSIQDSVNQASTNHTLRCFRCQNLVHISKKKNLKYMSFLSNQSPMSLFCDPIN